MSRRFFVASFCAFCLSSAFREFCELEEVGAQDRLLAQAERLGQSAVPGDLRVGLAGQVFDRIAGGLRLVGLIRSARRGRGGVSDLLGLCCLHRLNRIAAARDLREAGVHRVRGAAHVRAGFGRIQLEQKVAGLDCLAGLDVNRGHLAGIERLDHFGIAEGLDLSRGDGVHVEPAEIRPCQGDDGESGNRRHHGDWQRRRRRLEDFKRSGQELAIASGDRIGRARRRRGRGRRRSRRRSALVHAGALA